MFRNVLEADEMIKVTPKLGVIADGLVAYTPANYRLEVIIIQNLTANAVTLDVGTSAGGSEILSSWIIAANSIKILEVGDVFSSTVRTGVYLSSSNWNSSRLYVYCHNYNNRG